MTLTAAGAERRRVDGFGRLDLGVRQASDWYLWGPYVSERQWGTVATASTRLGPAKEHQPELPHPNLVAVGQHSRMDRLPVDVRAVEAAHIDDPEFTSFAADFGMATADGYVVEDDVAVEMAPCCCDRLIQPKSVTGVGSAPNNEHGGAGRHPLKSGHAVLGVG
jgi:hypothetical protein